MNAVTLYENQDHEVSCEFKETGIQRKNIIRSYTFNPTAEEEKILNGDYYEGLIRNILNNK